MNEDLRINLGLSLGDINILQDIISNSTPTMKFSVVADFVSRINRELQGELQKIQEQQIPNPEPTPVENPLVKAEN